MIFRRATVLLCLIAAVLTALMASPAQAARPVRAPKTGSARSSGTTTSKSVKTTRACAAATKGHASCFALRRTDVTQPAGVKAKGVSPLATPSGLSPANLQSAYKLSTTAGSGQTVAIVDAYNDPNAAADLAVYRSQYGLPACTVASGCFRQVNQNGATSPLPTNDSGWAGEISLDVDMVSAACPACKILLVEANSASDANLYAAVNQAVTMGAKFVSNSWGGAEYSGQTTDDSTFNHPGVAITVSSGDDATGAEYPATSKYVTAVGGTHLTTSTNARGWTESAWSNAGSGCSAYDPKPTWQTVTTSCSRRAEADVSAVADPATGVAVYQTYGASGWAVYGGTSASAPIVASVYALAGTPGASDSPASYPYAHASSLFDVTSGSNGSCGAPICTAGAGWDGPTGLGTPNGSAAFTAGTGGGGGGGSGCTAAQLLGNPGFETGSASPWTASSGVVSASSANEAAHGGTHMAWLDGYGSTHTDTLSQSVTIPAACTSATFSFWIHIDTAETSTSTAYDKLTVKAGSTTLATYSNLNKATGYVQKSFSLASFAGSTVTLSFSGVEDSGLQTSFVLDDLAVNVS